MDWILTHVSLTWAILAGALIIIEVMIPHFGCLFPGIAAAAAFAVSFHYSATVQLTVFSVVLVLGLVLLRPWLAKKMHTAKGVPSRGHALIGKHGSITSLPSAHELGRVSIEGQDWAIRSEEKLSLGDQVKVTTVDGIVLIVKK